MKISIFAEPKAFCVAFRLLIFLSSLKPTARKYFTWRTSHDRQAGKVKLSLHETAHTHVIASPESWHEVNLLINFLQLKSTHIFLIHHFVPCRQKKIGFLFQLSRPSSEAHSNEWMCVVLLFFMKNDLNYGHVDETCYRLHCDTRNTQRANGDVHHITGLAPSRQNLALRRALRKSFLLFPLPLKICFAIEKFYSEREREKESFELMKLKKPPRFPPRLYEAEISERASRTPESIKLDFMQMKCSSERQKLLPAAAARLKYN